MDKIQWLINYIKENGHANALDADLVDAYTSAFPVKFEVKMWGANRCKDLSMQLSSGYKMGIFNRKRVGLSSGAWQPGLPKWVYVYEIR